MKLCQPSENGLGAKSFLLEQTSFQKVFDVQTGSHKNVFLVKKGGKSTKRIRSPKILSVLQIVLVLFIPGLHTSFQEIQSPVFRVLFCFMSCVWWIL